MLSLTSGTAISECSSTAENLGRNLPGKSAAQLMPDPVYSPDPFFAMLIVWVGRKQLISSSLARAWPAGARGERMRCPTGTSAGWSEQVCSSPCPGGLQEASLPES